MLFGNKTAMNHDDRVFHKKAICGYARRNSRAHARGRGEGHLRARWFLEQICYQLGHINHIHDTLHTFIYLCSAFVFSATPCDTREKFFWNLRADRKDIFAPSVECTSSEERRRTVPDKSFWLLQTWNKKANDEMSQLGRRQICFFRISESITWPKWWRNWNKRRLRGLESRARKSKTKLSINDLFSAARSFAFWEVKILTKVNVRADAYCRGGCVSYACHSNPDNRWSSLFSSTVH